MPAPPAHNSYSRNRRRAARPCLRASRDSRNRSSEFHPMCGTRPTSRNLRTVLRESPARAAPELLRSIRTAPASRGRSPGMEHPRESSRAARRARRFRPEPASSAQNVRRPARIIFVALAHTRRVANQFVPRPDRAQRILHRPQIPGAVIEKSEITTALWSTATDSSSRASFEHAYFIARAKHLKIASIL